MSWGHRELGFPGISSLMTVGWEDWEGDTAFYLTEQVGAINCWLWGAPTAAKSSRSGRRLPGLWGHCSGSLVATTHGSLPLPPFPDSPHMPRLVSPVSPVEFWQHCTSIFVFNCRQEKAKDYNTNDSYWKNLENSISQWDKQIQPHLSDI